MTHNKTKVIKQAYHQYMNSNTKYLNQCYERYSHAKEIAYNYCVDMMNKLNGHSGRIISYNVNIFTFGFIGYLNNKAIFVYITPSYDRYIFIDEINEGE